PTAASCSTRAPSSPTRFRLPSGSSAPRSGPHPQRGRGTVLMTELGRAAFLDRDGTILEDPGFLHQPGKARLLPGAGEAVHQLNAAGVLVVTVSNQSGIARGLYTVADYHAVQLRLGELLAGHLAYLDGSYFCPHHPDVTG